MLFFLLWGSLVAMEFSDPETNLSPNQLADIWMHTLELLIQSQTPPLREDFPLWRLWKAQNVVQTLVLVASTVQRWAVVSKWNIFKGLIMFQGLCNANLAVSCINVGPFLMVELWNLIIRELASSWVQDWCFQYTFIYLCKTSHGGKLSILGYLYLNIIIYSIDHS